MLVCNALAAIGRLWFESDETNTEVAPVIRTKQAIELNTLCMRYPIMGKLLLWKNLSDQQLVTTALPPEEIAAALERGRNRDLWDAAEEVLAVLKSST